MTEDIDFSAILPSIEVHHFPLILNLNADGMVLAPGSSILVTKRSAFLTCPYCRSVGDFYKIGEGRNFDVVYCKGGQPPEIEHQSLFGGTHKHQIPCSPIHFSHFHVKCFICEEVFFLHTPTEK